MLFEEICSHLGKPMWKANSAVAGQSRSGFQIWSRLDEPGWKPDFADVSIVLSVTLCLREDVLFTNNEFANLCTDLRILLSRRHQGTERSE